MCAHKRKKKRAFSPFWRLIDAYFREPEILNFLSFSAKDLNLHNLPLLFSKLKLKLFSCNYMRRKRRFAPLKKKGFFDKLSPPTEQSRTHTRNATVAMLSSVEWGGAAAGSHANHYVCVPAAAPPHSTLLSMATVE